MMKHIKQISFFISLKSVGDETHNVIGEKWFCEHSSILKLVPFLGLENTGFFTYFIEAKQDF
jgi:hypothetical protein